MKIQFQYIIVDMQNARVIYIQECQANCC